MNPLNRRDVLRWGVLGAGSSALSNLLSPLRALGAVRAAGATAPSLCPAKIFVMFQRGASDALHTLSAVGDPTFDAVRGGLAIPAGDLLPFAGSVDGYARLHKSMAPLLAAGGPAADGKLAIVTRVGNPLTNRSHFEQQDIWESASMPPSNEGWIARLAGVAGFDPSFPTASVSRRLQLAFRSTDPNRRCVHIKSLDGYSLGALDNLGSGTNPIPPQFTDGLRDDLNTHLGQPFAPGLEDLVASTHRFTLDTEAAVQDIKNNFVHDAALFPQTNDEARDAGLPTGFNAGLAFARNCEEAVAVLKDPNTACRAAGVEIGGWDTHTAQIARRTDLDLTFWWLVAAVCKALKNTNTTILVVTEFGRQLRPNADAGTDHGQGSMVVACGDGVKKNGIWHCHGGAGLGVPWVRLQDILDNPNPTPAVPNEALDVRCDFRAVLGELMVKRFGVTLAQLSTIMPGFVPAAGTITEFPGIFKIDRLGMP